ncbi:MAG: phenylacetate-CoA oxygenase subunit PaaJ [Chitinophagaceae bacterium]|nr:MAG: phenylacetate-CoA oxygenase subunit PaaJ [Chitinophagaceae bacterium]
MNATETDIAAIKQILGSIPDPELPILSIVDLGIIREIKFSNETIEINITPTYSGCPAIDVIDMEIRATLDANQISNYKLIKTLSPPWTTEWMTESGKQKLKEHGIAPPLPLQSVCETEYFQREEAVTCPLCGSYNTRMISRFGSTACKAQYQCNECSEPFDYFKCH